MNTARSSFEQSGVISGNGSLNTSCMVAPRRMFLCDVPLFAKQISTDSSTNLVRLMGTVAEMMTDLPLPLPATGSESSPSPRDTNSTMHLTTSQTSSISNSSTCVTRLIRFVIDDGTGTIAVFARRRVEKSSNSIPSANILHTRQQQLLHNTAQNRHLKTTNQSLPAAVTLESILSSPQCPILVGQTVDCIGRITSDTNEEFGRDNANDDNRRVPSLHKIWLAASSVSMVNNPQAISLRHLELSSAKRLERNPCVSTDCMQGRGGNIPKNRILVGGELESKLNPLFHSNHQASVVFNIEDAFNYIKYSKGDGGITTQELALLVGAGEPNEKSAVNSAVEQLREDCRIYLNQGKWFPL